MADFRVDVFKGIRPRISSRLLPLGEAQTAENARLGSGKLEPLNSVLLAEDESVSGGSTAIHRMYNNGSPFWLASESDVDYARGPVPNDELERTYYTGETEPRMTYVGLAPEYRYLGIPAPTTAPTVVGDDLPALTISGTSTADSFDTNMMRADVSYSTGWSGTSGVDWYMTSEIGGYEAVDTARVLTMDFYVGQELRVASVVDANTVTLEDANGGPYLAASAIRDRSHPTNNFRDADTGTTRAAYMRFYVPNGTQVTLPTHELEVGDVIRITALPSPPSLVLTQNTTGTLDGMFFGAEADGHPEYDSSTWPDAVTIADDGFYVSGGQSYPFVELWSDIDGPAGTNSFVLQGSFSWDLFERDGVSYEDTASEVESRVYVYTFVSDIGEEGPPSPASDVVTVPALGGAEVSDFESPPTEQRSITHMRIYRANSGTDQTVFQFVAEIASPFDDYTDAVAGVDLGEILQTESWDPPESEMVGITALPNGGMAGFFGKTVCFAEPYFPHAWPPEYQIAVDHDVIGLGIVPNGVAILTKGPVYIAAGDHPRAMSTRHFNSSQACSSKRSIASTTDGVLYSAPDGLAFVGSQGFKLVTEPYVTKREWQDQFAPTEIKGFWHDDKYIAFFDEGGFVFDPTDDSVGLTTHEVDATAGYLDTENDVLYLSNPEFVAGASSAALVVIARNQNAGDVLKMTAGRVFSSIKPAGSGTLWRGVAYSAQHTAWVLCGPTGTPALCRSINDGVSWTTAVVSGGGSQAWQRVASSGSRFVVVSSEGTGRIAYSDDGGANWTAVTTYDANAFKEVIWDPYRELFVALCDTSGFQLLTSENGITWTARATPIPMTSPMIGDAGHMISATEAWIVVSANNSNPQLRSADGITWSQIPNASGGLVCQGSNDTQVVTNNGVSTWKVTSDGGTTAWVTPTTPPSDGGPVEYSDDLGLWFVFSNGTALGQYHTASNPAGVWSTTAEPLLASHHWVLTASGDGSTVVGIWDGDVETPLTATWKSGRLRCPYPLNLGAARVHADEYPGTFKLYNDQGDLVTTRTIASDEVIRLPSGYLTTWFEMELESAGAVNTVHVAETVIELLSE